MVPFEFRVWGLGFRPLGLQHEGAGHDPLVHDGANEPRMSLGAAPFCLCVLGSLCFCNGVVFVGLGIWV